MGWNPGSEIRDPEKPIPDRGSRGQKGTGSRIRIRNTDLRKGPLSTTAFPASQEYKKGQDIQKILLNV